MRIAVVGGHLSCAIAFMQALPKENEVFFLGRKHALEGDSALSFEYETIIKFNVPFFEVKAARFQRNFSKYSFPSLIRAPYGLYQSVSILKKIKPDVVIGFGGYVFLSVALAAYFLHIPVVLHEQTLQAGLANKIVSKFACKVCISWESSFGFFPKAKTILTGNPIRREILKAVSLKKEGKRGKPLIYITGGSLGSHVLNEAVRENLISLLQNYTLLHQTGNSRVFNDFEVLRKEKASLKKELQERYTVVESLDPENVGEAFLNSSLVLSRSGINTVTELLLFNKPCLLVPLSFSARAEQEKNALMLQQEGLARIMQEKDLSGDILIKTIDEMMSNLEKYKADRKVIEKLLAQNPAEELVKVVLDAAQKKKTQKA